MKYFDVKLKLKFNCNCLKYVENAQIIKNCIFLENIERENFLSKTNKYIYANNFFREYEIKSFAKDFNFSTEFYGLDNMIDMYIAFDNQTSNSNNYFNYENILKNMAITINNEKRANFDNLYYSHYMQYKYKNTCDNVYVYSFSLDPISASYRGSGNCNANTLNFSMDLHQSNVCTEYKMKIIIRYYSVISISDGDYDFINKNHNDYKFEIPSEIYIYKEQI